MNRTIYAILWLGFVSLAMPLFASSLSVVSLGEALQNSDLVDTKSDAFQPALDAVQGLLLNQPADEAERASLQQHVSDLARYRNTRVGKLFFHALKAAPAIENLPKTATFAELTVRWPLSFGSDIRVRVAFEPADGGWKISTLEVTADGVAAAPISGMAPYFGTGQINPDLLDAGPIDYLVGRDPADREKPESDRDPFDFDAAVDKLFAGEDGAFEQTVNDLVKNVTPETAVKKRIAALTPHLATKTEAETMVAASDDPERSVAFWKGMFEQLKDMAAAPRPSAVPTAAGSDVSLRYRLTREDESVEGMTSALRLDSGEIAPRGGTRNEGLDNGEEG